MLKRVAAAWKISDGSYDPFPERVERTMNGAELKTLREACGLSVGDMAKMAVSPRTGSPVGERTVRYWESGSVPVPEDVSDMLVKLDTQLSYAAKQALEAWRAAVQMHRHGPYMVYLVRYREDEDLWRYRSDMKGLPATCHAALINRARIALCDVGCITKIVWMNPAEYSKWLKGRKDNESLRAEWAATELG